MNQNWGFSVEQIVVDRMKYISGMNEYIALHDGEYITVDAGLFDSNNFSKDGSNTEGTLQSFEPVKLTGAWEDGTKQVFYVSAVIS